MREGKHPIYKSVQVFSPVTKNHQEIFKENFNVWSGEKNSEKESHDNHDQLLNIDNLPKNGLHVKLVLKTSSGNVLMRTPRHERTKCLVRQIKMM